MITNKSSSIFSICGILVVYLWCLSKAALRIKLVNYSFFVVFFIHPHITPTQVHASLTSSWQHSWGWQRASSSPLSFPPCFVTSLAPPSSPSSSQPASYLPRCSASASSPTRPWHRNEWQSSEPSGRNPTPSPQVCAFAARVWHGARIWGD